ncbi:MAG: 2-iminoacetate synthase [Candidatus Sumerlaeota bacterium]|nr:2-iminoacetate synthase [Candidatus Sumerlaeota bacterium]
MSSFADVMEQTDFAAVRELIASRTASDVEHALAAEQLSADDLAALLSPAAADFIEQMAQRSAALTEQRFGRVVQMYAPLYLSNECVNKCTYCGFSHELKIARKTLSVEEVVREAKLIREEGFRHLLLVSGEDRRFVNIPYLLEVVSEMNKIFDSLAIEIQPLQEDEYRQLVLAGVDGLVIYQELYDPERYRLYHVAGPKRNYRNRLLAIEGGGRAGMRSLGIGTLLGLGDWRTEAWSVGLHGRWLSRHFWQSRLAVSFPRIRDCAGEYTPDLPVGDPEFVQMICAMRLFLPDAELVMSTREPAALRDNLIGLGVTRMSAGSKTNPGGYASQDHEGEQFEIEDGRPPEEIARIIEERGFEAVWKDFDREFVAPRGG